MTRRTAARLAIVDNYSDDEFPAKSQPGYSDLVNALAAKVQARWIANVQAAYAACEGMK